VAAARGLGLAAGKPVAGLCGFRLMAHRYLLNPRSNSEKNFGLAMPAGHAAAFCACYNENEEMSEGIEILPLDEAAHWFAERVSTVSGPAAPALTEIAARHGCGLRRGVDGLTPDSETLAALAPSLDPAVDLPIPLYVRPADARPQTDYAVARKGET
jgi:tRNA threonylcarbamoyladenosine biosynthesis protein TsaB